jgi:nucleoside 2-deoxyribosyltransferase
MKLFLSVPFSSKTDKAGNVNTDYRAYIQQVLEGLRGNGHTVFCALEHTGWHLSESMAPEEEFRQDLAEIDEADKLIVLLEEQVSPGVQIEIGYAYAKGKQLELYQVGEPKWSNISFSRLSGHELRRVRSLDEFVEYAISEN